MTAESTLPDGEARRRIVEDLASTLVVEAGAGSGKTSALVGRVVALVRSGVPLEQVAAITFTEKAAAELAERIRAELEDLLATARNVGDGPAAQRAAVALDQLDSAAIGTLHAFARRVLAEHPVEAGLPPRVEVRDEVSSEVAFDRRWATFLDELLAEEHMARPLLLLGACGVRPESLRALALRFEANWDLVAEEVPERSADPPAVRDLFEAAAAAVESVCSAPCRDPSDKLVLRLGEIGDYLHELRGIEDELELLEALTEGTGTKRPSFAVGGLGRRASFDDVDALRREVAAAGACLDNVVQEVAQACAHVVGSAIRRFTLRAADERRGAGELAFHDLLVLARRLLRDAEHGPAVRRRLHDRYSRLLLDEFQDTDPIQIELAVRIAAAEPGSAEAGARPWDEVTVEAGRLFVVGDPKQSIYRFRRADVATFLRAEERFGAGRGLLQLTANFRSVAPVIDWVNHTFAALMPGPASPAAAGAAAAVSQPAYLPLVATRGTPPAGAGVAVLGRQSHPQSTRADELRAREAADVAAAILRAVGERWSADDGAGGWRPARLGDIAVLVPARTSVPFLEDALDEAGIPFRAEATSLVYTSSAVRDLLMVLRAVADPTNRLHVLAALRTPLLACGDDDLFRFKVERGGHFGLHGDQPETVPADDPVLAGLGYLGSLHDDSYWLAAPELLDQVVRERRLLELCMLDPRPRDQWRRIRFLVDQARAWADVTGGNLRQYLAWVSRQAAEGARASEAVLPETDDDAVRVMTIHAAKGLEFPVTIVSGMSTQPQRNGGSVQVSFTPRGVGYRLGRNVVTSELSDWRPVDEQMDADERIRLLYVACTRARDHLVVSLHRAARANAPQPAARTGAELLVDGMGALLASLPDGVVADDRARRDGAAALGIAAMPAAPLVPFEEWKQAHDSALQAASRRRVVAATALGDEGLLDVDVEPAAAPDPGLQKRPRDLDLPPWLKGRYGTAVGRAVHGVLQSIDLATGAGLDELVAAQCQAEAIPGRGGDVAALVRAALGSVTVREAAATQHWRELYLCAPIGARLLEGYVDLLYRRAQGLVVVDHKTAATADPGELDRRVEAYVNQGAAYALAVGLVTGEEIARVTFVFLTPLGAVERSIPALDAEIDRVRRLVEGGEDLEILA